MLRYNLLDSIPNPVRPDPSDPIDFTGSATLGKAIRGYFTGEAIRFHFGYWQASTALTAA